VANQAILSAASSISGVEVLDFHAQLNVLAKHPERMLEEDGIHISTDGAKELLRGLVEMGINASPFNFARYTSKTTDRAPSGKQLKASKSVVVTAADPADKLAQSLRKVSVSPQDKTTNAQKTEQHKSDVGKGGIPPKALSTKPYPSPSYHSKRGGGAVATRGGAVATRGGAVATRGGAVATRGGAVASRGSPQNIRGGHPSTGTLPAQPPAQ
jgi:hypothetical protein